MEMKVALANGLRDLHLETDCAFDENLRVIETELPQNLGILVRLAIIGEFF